jgi:hypothetical protein
MSETTELGVGSPKVTAERTPKAATKIVVRKLDKLEATACPILPNKAWG